MYRQILVMDQGYKKVLIAEVNDIKTAVFCVQMWWGSNQIKNITVYIILHSVLNQ